MESKKEFHQKIKEYYTNISNRQIPEKILTEVIHRVTYQIYEDYKRSWKKYPKSRKRYSILKMEDIEHPFIHYLITDFLHFKKIKEFHNYSKILFQMNDEEYEAYLDRKNWYETK